MTKLKELLNLPLGIVGEIEIMKIVGNEPQCYEYKNLKEAAKKHEEEEVLQIFGSNWKITIVTFEVQK